MSNERLSARSRRLVPISLGVLVGASAVAVGVLGQQAIVANAAERDATAAMDAARTGTVQVLSYDARTLEADLARARTQITGPFVEVFEDVAEDVTGLTSRQEVAATRAEVVRSALIGAQDDRAEVLLFLDRVTTAPAQPEPQRGSVQVKVTMTRTADGRWLISEIQPL